MNTDENEIFEFLRGYGDNYVSVAEISKRLQHRKRYDTDRNWARPLLRRMELDGLLEANDFGEYRIHRGEEDTTFKQAISSASLSIDLGDTTIVSFGSGSGR